MLWNVIGYFIAGVLNSAKLNSELRKTQHEMSRHANLRPDILIGGWQGGGVQGMDSIEMEL